MADKALQKRRYRDCTKDLQTIMPFLYDYQRDCVIRGVVEQSLLNSEETGMGKSLESLAVATYNRNQGWIKNIVVICPASIKVQWQREAKKWFNLSLEVITGTPKQRRKQFMDAKDGIIINYEKLMGVDYKYIEQFVKQDGMLIFDEASYLKNEKTGRTIKAMELRQHTNYCMPITGTPIETKLKDGFIIGKLVDENWMSDKEFYNNYCVYEENYAGFRVLVGYKNVEEFMEKLSKISICRKKCDVKEMPPKTVYNRIVALSPQQKRITAFIEKEYPDIIKIENKENQKKGIKTINMDHPESFILPMLENAVELIMVSQSKIATKIKKHMELKKDSPKLKELVAVIDELSDNKIVIFTRFKKMIPFITASLGGDECLVGSGETKDRIGLIDEFKSNNDKRFLVVTEAFSYGVDIPFATALINFDIPWNHAKLHQRSERIYRITSKYSVTIINLISDGFEQYIYDKMMIGSNLADQFSAKRVMKEYLNG